MLHSKEHTVSICNKEELPQQRKELIIAPIYNTGDNTDLTFLRKTYFLYHLHTKFYPCFPGTVNAIHEHNYW